MTDTTTPRTLEELLDDFGYAIRHDKTDVSVCDARMAIVRYISEGKGSCEWDSQDEGGPIWSSGCGEEFWSDGDCAEPREWMKFCPYCGGKAAFPEAK